jgi:phosphosulfolactate synthase (CoM biosynthesis protein A)
MGRRYLADILDTMGVYVDSLKFAGGSFALMPPSALSEIIEPAHRYHVLVQGAVVQFLRWRNERSCRSVYSGCGDLGRGIKRRLAEETAPCGCAFATTRARA